MIPPTTPSNDHVFLIGRPPIGEFIGFIRTMAVNGHTVDQGLLAEEWRRANDHVIGLEKAEAGIADGVAWSALPRSLTDLADRVRTEPSFAQTFRFVPVEFGMVELDRLIVYQKFINLGFVGLLRSTFPRKTDGS
jgi:hypothetical protein